MKNRFFKSILFSTLAGAMLFTSCESDDTLPDSDNNGGDNTTERWITIAGAAMGTNPGDGNGGTFVYSVSKTDAKNPEISISAFDNGFSVRSQRTARLQASEDGSTLFNIQYTGTDGGQLDKYMVKGGNAFQYIKGANASLYVGTSPRWAKLFDGDKTGVAVNVTTPTANNAGNEGTAFKYYRGEATVLALDLQATSIIGYKNYELPLSTQEELEGHHIFRLDSPVLNKAGNKLIIGTWMRKIDLATGDAESGYERLGTKSVVVD